MNCVGLPYLVLFLACLSLAQDRESYLKQDETTWARRLGLEPSYVSKIVNAAGFSEDDEVRIDNLDVRHLRLGKHILLVTAAGNGHCLTLTVIAVKAESMEKIWEMSELPGGGGLCHVGAYTGNYIARATADGAIVVDVPRYKGGNYPQGKHVAGIKRLVYQWNGETYVLKTGLSH
jgi:hypothetical protein